MAERGFGLLWVRDPRESSGTDIMPLESCPFYAVCFSFASKKKKTHLTIVMKNTLLKETGREATQSLSSSGRGSHVCQRLGVADVSRAQLISKLKWEKLRGSCLAGSLKSSFPEALFCSSSLGSLCCSLHQANAFCIRDQLWNWTQVQAAKGETAIVLFGMRHCSLVKNHQHSICMQTMDVFSLWTFVDMLIF